MLFTLIDKEARKKERKAYKERKENYKKAIKQCKTKEERDAVNTAAFDSWITRLQPEEVEG